MIEYGTMLPINFEQCVGLTIKFPIHVMIRFSQSLSCKHKLALLQTFPKFNHQDYSINYFMVMISKWWLVYCFGCVHNES